MEKEFHSLFEQPHQQIQRPLLRRGNRKVIKAERLKEAGQVQVFEAGDLNELRPEILIHQRDGTVQEIEFICPCGCRARLHLEVGDPTVEQDEPMNISQEKREAMAEPVL
ncbi:MAG: hypothetical protein D6715_12860 [Calditrichaeota bacterium]|nr:MAG: hypothetical protein D6715_12860 [Calditrichota bacterium]